MDEASLIIRCRHNDGKAQRELYEAYADIMLPVCLRYLKHVQEAEDALMQGFFKFFSNAGRFEYRGAGSIGALLRRMMINECLMQLRKTARLQLVEEAYLEVENSGDDVFSGLHAKDIFRLIAALPDGYRTVFNLYAVEGYTHREIAAVLRISEGTSKSQLSKAKRVLRQLLQQTNEYYAAG